MVQNIAAMKIRSVHRDEYRVKRMESMKNKAVRIIIAIIIALLAFSPVSAEKAYASTQNATKVPVLVYHSVGSRDKGKLQISKNKIEKQLNWIKKCGYKTLTMEEFVEWYEGERTIPKKSVLITFDDGYQNVVKNAVPILKRNKQHATMFIAGKWVGHSGYVSKSTVRKLQKGSVIDIESHGYALHNRDNKKMPAHKWSKAKLKADCIKMTDLYDCTVLCYPWGATSKNLRNALKETGTYRVAFTYARVGQYQGTKNKYATKGYSKYTIPRITISAYDSWTSIKKWVKP